MPDIVNAGAAVREARQAKDWTLARLGEQTGMTVYWLSKIERGRVVPSLKAQAKLADALELPREQLRLAFEAPAHLALAPDDSPFRRARKLARYSGQELADAAGVSKSTISDLELGYISPTLELARGLAHILGVAVADIFTEFNEREFAFSDSDNSIRRRRKAMRMTIADLSRTTGIKWSSLQMYDSGKAPPPPDALAKISLALGEKRVAALECMHCHFLVKPSVDRRCPVCLYSMVEVIKRYRYRLAQARLAVFNAPR